jgi:MFS family permease
MTDKQRRTEFFFVNLGHFFDHYLILIFATVAVAIASDRRVVMAAPPPEWAMTYAEIIPYSVAGFVAFGVFSIPAGWLADKWSRPGMMVAFFLGMGVATMLAAFAQTPWHLAVAVTLIGVFGAIYHPVGIAMVVDGRLRSGTGVPLAINGVAGNLGVAAAPLVTLFAIEWLGWRAAFLIPGAVSVVVGLAYLLFVARVRRDAVAGPIAKPAEDAPDLDRATLLRIFVIIFITASLGGFIFQSTSFALPKIFDERLGGLATSGQAVGWWTFFVFAAASVAQLYVGYRIDRASIRVVFAVAAGLQALFFFAMLDLDGLAALIVAVAFMLTVFGQIPIQDTMIGRIAKGAWRSRAYGIRYVVTFAVTASTVPVVAAIHGSYGFWALFLALGIAAALVTIASLFLPRAGIERPAPA